MTHPRLLLAQFTSHLFPPLISNRVNLRWIYPFHHVPQNGSSFRSRAVSGSYYHGITSDYHGYMFRIHGYFDWRVIAVAGAVLKRGDTMIEVGANVGTETVNYADLVGPEGKVYAIEPLPSNLQQLRTLNELSGLRQVEILPVAVSDRVGTVEFTPPPDSASSGVGHIRGSDPVDESSLLRIPCTTLDTLFENRGPIKLLCIDAEGVEPCILRGAHQCLERDRPVLILEAAADLLRRYGGSLAQLHGDLTALGYRVYQLSRLSLSPADLTSNTTHNWVAIPDSKTDLAARIQRRLRLCGLLPCLRGLNPLAWRRKAVVRSADFDDGAERSGLARGGRSHRTPGKWVTSM